MFRRVGSLGVQGRLGVPFRGLLRRRNLSAEGGGQNGRGWAASQAPAATARMEARMEKFEDRFLNLYKMYARQTQWMTAGLMALLIAGAGAGFAISDKIDKKFEEFDKKFEEFDKKFDKKFEALNAKLDKRG